MTTGGTAKTPKHGGPSVVQVRGQNVLPDATGEMVVRVLTEHAVAIESGALVTVDRARAAGSPTELARSNCARINGGLEQRERFFEVALPNHHL